MLPGFITYMKVERQFSPATISKYRDNIQWFVREFGDRRAGDLALTDFISLKERLAADDGRREGRVSSIICAVKCILAYARDVHHARVFDLSAIRLPRKRRQPVVYLTDEELTRFLQAIPIRNWDGQPRLSGCRVRALVEILAASGMRISEALSLNREDIKFEEREAVIVGKGKKQRKVYFTGRALDWLKQYLALRTDSSPALFATSTGVRLCIGTVDTIFRRITKWAGIEKRVTPHILRHTMATRLLSNGCPIGFIKEMLGHERLETTCRFYLGVLDEGDRKKAYENFLHYNIGLEKPPFQPEGEGRSSHPYPSVP
ncbi:MAG: hypothetical protein AUI54_02950 [Acidobacteria bacterium 13_1_40CM_2_56_5]|nr:MAG: hypothetical protein AUI54_02950 [Acidobacteria bacterium 13_1_40CM_2_56_5]